MLYTELTRKALALAAAAYTDQLDRSGYPYLLHTILVAEKMQNETAAVTALLHDIAVLRPGCIAEIEASFPAEVTDALRLLTWSEDEPYARYIRKLNANPIAKAVKLADLEQELDIRRLPPLTAEGRERYRESKALMEHLLHDVKPTENAQLTGISALADEALRDKLRGCMLGGAIGDALGRPLSFFPVRSVEYMYPEGIELQTNLENVAEVSDVTLQTLFTAAGLLHGETYSYITGEKAEVTDHIYKSLVDWTYTGRGLTTWLGTVCDFEDRSRSRTCEKVLCSEKRGSVYRPVNSSKGCSGLMRSAPIALYFKGDCDIEVIDYIAAEAAAITHGHPLAFLPAAVFVHILRRTVYGGCAYGNSMSDLIADSKETLATLYGAEFPAELVQIYALLDKAVELSRNDQGDKENISVIGKGWTADEALAIAIYAACKYQNDFGRAVIAAAAYTDGDSSTAAALTGHILGATGAAVIVDKWLQKLEFRDIILEVADDIWTGPRNIDWRWELKYYQPCTIADDE